MLVGLWSGWGMPAQHSTQTQVVYQLKNMGNLVFPMMYLFMSSSPLELMIQILKWSVDPSTPEECLHHAAKCEYATWHVPAIAVWLVWISGLQERDLGFVMVVWKHRAEDLRITPILMMNNPSIDGPCTQASVNNGIVLSNDSKIWYSRLCC